MNPRSHFFKELHRRNVTKVAVAYVVSAWLIAQVSDLVLDNFAAPDWAMRAVLVALAIGFPIALIISWAFEVTPQGVIPESQRDRTLQITDQSGKRLDRVIIGILAVVIIFLGLERFVFSGRDGKPGPATTAMPGIGAEAQQQTNSVQSRAPVPSDSSVAVLPFAVMSTGPDDTYFADGLTEEIINALSQLPQLMVTARTSAFHFKDQHLPVGEIADQLGVAHIVEGSVRRAGEQLRITAQLIRASDGFHLWSETYDRRTEDTFAVQQDIAEKVAAALNVVLDEDLRERMLQVGIRNVEAFTAHQKGHELFEKAHGTDADITLLRQGNQMFERAYTLAPELSDAYIQHADLYTHILMSEASGQLDGNITNEDIATAPAALKQDYDRAMQYARNADERVKFEADRALILGEWRGLNTLSDRSLGQTGCTAGYWIHLATGPFGKAREMQSAFTRMAECDPFTERATVHRITADLWLGRPELALQQSRVALQESTHHSLIWAEVMALAMLDQFSEARQAVANRPLTQEERPFVQSMLAALEGRKEASIEFQNTYLNRHGPNDQSSLVLEALRGNRAEANRLAGLIDRRPFGYMSLMQAIYLCACGAPFDLDAAPVFASKLAGSGLPWPPQRPLELPLKPW